MAYWTQLNLDEKTEIKTEAVSIILPFDKKS